MSGTDGGRILTPTQGRARHPFLDAPGRLRSLNVARIAALPADLERDDVIGRRGLELVSGLALAREIGSHADELGLSSASPTLLQDFDAILRGARTQTSPAAARAARTAAEAMAIRLGRRLGCLLLMFVQARPENRALRDDWAPAQWAFWEGVTLVVVGGGLLSGAIGDVAIPAAQDVLDRHGAARVRLVRSPWAERIGLVGLARSWPAAGSRRTVVDFGQSSVKAGVASYEDGILVGLAISPPEPGPCSALIGLSEDCAEVERQWSWMLERIVAMVDRSSPSPGEPVDVALSLACYLDDGQPDETEAGSCYGRLRVLGPNLRDLMRDRLADRLGADVRLVLLPDGDAAALAVEPDDRAVVITVGTAMAVGFPDRSVPRISIDSDLGVAGA